MDVQVIVFWSRVVAGAMAGVGVLFLVWAGARWRPGREKKFCPGTRGKWRMSPLRLVTSRACGYDLSGLRQGERGEVTCPECGRKLSVRVSALKSASRWRPLRMGVVMVLMAAVVVGAPMLKTHSWQKYVPTTVLIGVKRAMGPEWTPTRLRRELDKRLARGGLYAWQVRWVIPVLQRDLRDDKATWNAQRAMDRFEELGPRGRAALEESLLSSDRQERQMAAAALRRECWKWGSEDGRKLTGVQPSERLIRTTVEGLASDTMCWSSGTYDNAWEGFEFLILFPEKTVAALGAGLESKDEQQRVLCAALVAHAGHAAWYDRAIPILLAHLADNGHCGDARLSGRALHWIGPEASAGVVELLGHGDLQQRKIATLLLRHFQEWPSPCFGRELRTMVSTEDAGDWAFGLEMGWLGSVPARFGRMKEGVEFEE